MAVLLVAAPAHAGWISRLLAVSHLPQAIARRDAARAGLAAIGAQTHPDPVPYKKAQALAEACVEGVPPGPLVDASYVAQARGLSLAQVVEECRALAAQAGSEAERASAAQLERAQAIRPLLKGDRLKIFDAEGEPDCTACAGDPAKIARAHEWIYVRGPTGPLATYETLSFVFRGDKLVERRQRLSHEQP